MSSLGWHCEPVEGAHYIASPLTLGGTRPLDCYVSETNDAIRITDDGGVFWSLRMLGYPIEEGRAQKPLQQLAQASGIELDDNGCFVAKAPKAEAGQLFGRWIKFFSAVSGWEKERTDTEDADLSFIAAVHEILARDKSRDLVECPTVTAGGTNYPFDFRLGQLHVDAVSAHATATNARLRKALMVQRVEPDFEMLFVVDDRKSVDRADREVAVLASVARAVPLRNLAMALAA